MVRDDVAGRVPVAIDGNFCGFSKFAPRRNYRAKAAARAGAVSFGALPGALLLARFSSTRRLRRSACPNAAAPPSSARDIARGSPPAHRGGGAQCAKGRRALAGRATLRRARNFRTAGTAKAGRFRPGADAAARLAEAFNNKCAFALDRCAEAGVACEPALQLSSRSGRSWRGSPLVDLARGESWRVVRTGTRTNVGSPPHKGSRSYCGAGCSGLRGNRTVKQAPPPGRLLATMVTPCAFAIWSAS